MTENAYDVLKERGFIEQVSDEEGVRAAVEQPITCYVGFDPSADSFHVGHLVPIMALAHFSATVTGPSPSWAAALAWSAIPATRTRCAGCSPWSRSMPTWPT